MLKVKAFVSGSVEEMKEKVTWPPFSELQSSSLLVLVGCVLFAASIGLMDLFFKNLMEWFYSAF
ncbi:preprotein translocase subunit SecE [Fulvitalea axinellae]